MKVWIKASSAGCQGSKKSDTQEMANRPTLGDVIAVALLSSVLAGFISGFLIGAFLLGPDYWANSTMSALSSAGLTGALGIVIAFFTAGPLGVLIGGLYARFVGWSAAHTFFAGAITALVLVLVANWGGPWPDFSGQVLLLFFVALGGALAAICRQYVLHCAGNKFNRKRYP